MANEPLHPQNLATSVRALSYFPLMRQIGVMIGLAASVALGVAAVMWVQTPGFRPLYANLAEKDQARVIEELAKANIPHKIDPATGAVLVPDKQMHEARLKLAAQGLPKAGNNGFESMESGNSFGSSQFLETARYQHALEGELARSIMSISVVQSARVHLAIPKQSAFVRNRQQPSASVVVNLYAGRVLDEGQVAAIVHLVASSVPNLTSENVTIVDQQGRLLASNGKQQYEYAAAATRFEQTRKVEESYVKRIQDILQPIIGTGGVRAQVTLDMDFTVTEQTEESFNPKGGAVRSEQVAEEIAQPAAGAVAGGVGGVPGALSNQPPAAGVIADAAAKPADKADAGKDTKAAKDGKDAKGGKEGKDKAVGEAVAAAPANASRRAIRNYELGRTIQHTRAAPGKIKRLSVAVLVDNKQVVNADGEAERKPLAKEEIERLTALVKDAVGFNIERGDSVQVTNIAFSTPPEPEPLPDQAFFDKPWVSDLGKQSLAGFLILSIVFGVLRPMLRSLMSKPLPVETAMPGGAHPALMHAGGARQALPAGAVNYDTQLNTAKSLASQDPKRVAQVVKNWVANDG